MVSIVTLATYVSPKSYTSIVTPWFVLFILFSDYLASVTCQDIRQNCTFADCHSNPYEALKNCSNTCNNCDGMGNS